MNKTLTDLDTVALILHIDPPTDQLTPLQITAVSELKKREIDESELKELAIKANERIAYEMIKQEGILEEDVKMHRSKFLTEDEIREVYKAQVQKYMSYKDQFRFDVWSYAIGGI